MASAKGPGSLSGTSSPVDSWSTVWRQPRVSVTITGRPIAAASIGARGNPSRCEGSTNTSITESKRGHVLSHAREVTQVGHARLARLIGPRHVAAIVIQPPHQQQPDVGEILPDA